MTSVLAAGNTALFGQAELFVRLDFWLSLVALVAVIALGVWIALLWRADIVKEEPASIADQIQHYQDLMDKGQLDPAEFEQIKAQLEKQARGEDDDELPPPKNDPPPDTSIREM